MPLHTNADCLFFHYEGTPDATAMSSLKMSNMNKRGMSTTADATVKKTAEIIHNELIKPGTNTGNKATKKTQLVLMPSDSHQDQ